MDHNDRHIYILCCYLLVMSKSDESPLLWPPELLFSVMPLSRCHANFHVLHCFHHLCMHPVPQCLSCVSCILLEMLTHFQLPPLGSISNPIILANQEVLRPCNGFVKMSATLFVVLMNSIVTSPSCMWSWMKWYQVSICFNFQCLAGSLLTWMHPWLSV